MLCILGFNLPMMHLLPSYNCLMLFMNQYQITTCITYVESEECPNDAGWIVFAFGFLCINLVRQTFVIVNVMQLVTASLRDLYNVSLAY